MALEIAGYIIYMFPGYKKWIKKLEYYWTEFRIAYFLKIDNSSNFRCKKQLKTTFFR